MCVQRVSKALFIRPLRWKHAVHSLPACDVFHDPDSKCYFLFCHAWTVCRLCLTGTNLGQRKPHENTTNLERVLYLGLTLDWRWSDVLPPSTFTRGKTLTFFNIQIMCADVDAHNIWITVTRRSRESSTNSNARPANHNALTKILHFLCAGRAWWYVWVEGTIVQNCMMFTFCFSLKDYRLLIKQT